MRSLLAALLLGSSATALAEPPALPGLSIEEILHRGDASLRALGSYRVTLTAEERVGGRLRSPQRIELWVRESPRAVRLLYVGGPAAGRKGLYDERLRPGEIRVREHGLLGLAGPLWLSIHNPLTLQDTNHAVTEVGFGPLLALERRALAAAALFGGYRRSDEGVNERGRSCLRFDAPHDAHGLYAVRSRVCFDDRFLPVEMTNWDERGLLERFVFTDLQPGTADADFDLRVAGL